MPHYSEKNILHTKMFHDHSMDRIFEATAEAVEEAIVSSLYYGDTKSGVKGKVIHSLQDIME